MSRPEGCLGSAIWLGGCKFEPRYDEGEPTIAEISGGLASQQRALIEASKKRTYVRDVCTRCGRVLERGVA